MTLNGVFYGVKHAARQMTEQGHAGIIINISSGERAAAREGQVAYCAAKAGVDMITRCGALELGGRGIRVVGIAPGLEVTSLTEKELEDPATRKLLMDVIPMKRPVAGEEVAAVAVFLRSDKVRSINGDTIAIDGGSLTRGYPALLTGLKRASLSNSVVDGLPDPDRPVSPVGGRARAEGRSRVSRTVVQIPSMFHAFGTRVELFEAGPHILPSEDEEVVAAVAGELRSSGVVVHERFGAIDPSRRPQRGANELLPPAT